MYKTAKKYSKRIYRKAIKPYVSKKKGYKNRMKLYKEVAAIKKMVNAEKKQKDFSLVGQGIAQQANGSDGILCFSITPTITQGSGFDNRTGRSIKLSGLYLRAQMQSQTNAINRIQYNFMVITVKGKPQTTAEIIDGMFNVDSITGLRQFNCPRNPDNFTDYRIIASKNYFIEPDYITSQSQIVDIYMPLKLSHHIRYASNSTTIEEGELFFIIRGNRGDSGTADTGAFLNTTARLTYYDN